MADSAPGPLSLPDTVAKLIEALAVIDFALGANELPHGGLRLLSCVERDLRIKRAVICTVLSQICPLTMLG